MTFGIKLTIKEQAELDKYIDGLQRKREDEIPRDERSYLIYRYVKEIVIPLRKDTSERRANRRENIQKSHDSQLKWSHSRPPRHATTR